MGVGGAAVAAGAGEQHGPAVETSSAGDHQRDLVHGWWGLFVAAAPGGLLPWATVYDYFATWSADGTVDRVHERLRDAVRDEAGRDPMASGGVVDSQSAKGADTVGAGSRGYDAGNHAGWALCRVRCFRWVSRLVSWGEAGVRVGITAAP